MADGRTKSVMAVFLWAVSVIILSSGAIAENITYKFDMEYERVYDIIDTATIEDIIRAGKKLDNYLVKIEPSITPGGYAIEHEAVSWGQNSFAEAWNNVTTGLDEHQVRHGKLYDDPGYIKGTKSAYGKYGGYMWVLQNQLSFRTSASKFYTRNEQTYLIRKVCLGSFGAYEPATDVSETFPEIDSIDDRPGDNSSEKVKYDFDVSETYYKLGIIAVEFIDDKPDYALDEDEDTSDTSDNDSDNFFLRETDDHEDLDIYYRILPEDLDITDVKIKVYAGTSGTPLTELEGEKDGADFKTGDNLHVQWTPTLFDQDTDPGFYRLQLEVYVSGQADPICQTSIDDADGSTPGWQCPDDCLAIHDLVWKHRPIVYLGTGEVVGPPQHPFNSLMTPWIRHKNNPTDRSDPDGDISLIPPPNTYNDFGNLVGADYEAFLTASAQTAANGPYIDIHNDHLQATTAAGTLFHLCPLDNRQLIHANHAFIQFWMYQPSSHSPYNDWYFGDNVLWHEGDWEMCQFTVRLKNSEDPDSKKYWIEPFAATASQHYYGQTILWDRNKNGPASTGNWGQDYVGHQNNGNRVLIFIAQNAHATYFRPGDIDADGSAGCHTQVQYDPNPEFGYDRIVPQAGPLVITLHPLEPSQIYDWPGNWGQTYLHGALPPGHGPSSPIDRSAGIGEWDSEDPNRVYMATDPCSFHNECRKTSLSQDLELQ